MHRPHFSRYALLIIFVCAAVACAALFAPTGRVQTKDSNFHQQVSRSLRSYEAMRMSPADAELKVRQTGRLTLETSSGTFQLRLVPNDVRAANYRATAVKDGGEIVELAREPSRTFEGSVDGLEGSEARFTIDRGTIEGMIITRGEKFFVEPAAHFADGAAPGDFLFYRESDVIPTTPLECGVETLAEKVNERLSLAAAGPTTQAAVLSPVREADLATDADFEFFYANGSNVAATNNEILSIVNQVNGVYRAEIGLTFNVVYQRVWATSADPYDATTLDGLLAQVRTQWRDAPPAGSEARDIVHLWTGRDLDGFTAGLAYNDVTINGGAPSGPVCRIRELAVGVSERQTLAPQKYIVPAHEMGHNFGAHHPEQVGHPECALTIMSGTVMSNTVFSFCQFSRDEITNFVNANGSCLAASTALPTVQFSATNYSVTEGAGSVQLTVTRSDGTGASTVEFQTANGTADDRVDYTTAVGNVRFAAGETSKSFKVFVTDDAYGEGLENFQVQLTGASGATVGTPSAATVTITSNEVVNGPNPVKDPSFNPSFFVRQHYVDFLNREPDASGLSFWTGQTTNCGNSDLLVCRVNVSAAFFLSIEYQETGFYAIRAQRVAFGRRSDNPQTRMGYRELIRDQRLVGEGVVVGQAGYEQLLASNKLAYASNIAARADFASRFPQATADSYVDALFASAGVAPTPTERQEAINAYNGAGGGAAGRAAALRSVADSGSVRNAEIRAAFVLLEYHGYMRRDPDAVGYGFWLQKLNDFNGNYVAAEMVKAFITSDEYQQRFGQ